MSRTTSSRTQLLSLFIVSAIPRIMGAFWLPNAFGDAYAYTEQIYYMRKALLNGSFSVSNLFGFWLPLYQLICAAISAVAGDPFYVPKLISAVCGAGVCVLVFVLALELTSNKLASVIVTAILIFNPYHISYSSSALTDVPHAFFILLCAYCCIRRRWLIAACCGLAAGLMRIESWTLVLIIPFVQISVMAGKGGPACKAEAPVGGHTGRSVLSLIVAFLILAAGPVLWLFVSWKATGSWLRYFEIRNNYIVETLGASPYLASFAPARVAFDCLRFVYACNPVVLFASVALCFVTLRRAGILAVPNASAARSAVKRLCLAAVSSEGVLSIFFFSHLGFLLFAYFTRNQPDIWPRYGLIFFALGLPMLAAWISRPAFDFSRLTLSNEYRSRRVQVWVSVSVALFALQFCAQLVDVTRITVMSDPNVTVAQFLDDQRQKDGSMKIYCEDGAIRVLSGIPLEDFRNQYNSPRYESAADAQSFLNSLRDNQVRFLVYKDLPGSRLREIISRLQAHPGRDGITLEEVIPRSRKKAEAVIVYRVHDSEVAKVEQKR
ncbi:MAG TPA: phospholipid carrier-dependent glycosyltransferase [Pyrinomonadaceae bacterium]|nr:phospholipid carrier-dependent glycosyltransferase [Pyrinomonadaceae bacterium]